MKVFILIVFFLSLFQKSKSIMCREYELLYNKNTTFRIYEFSEYYFHFYFYDVEDFSNYIQIIISNEDIVSKQRLKEYYPNQDLLHALNASPKNIIINEYLIIPDKEISSTNSNKYLIAYYGKDSSFSNIIIWAYGNKEIKIYHI